MDENRNFPKSSIVITPTEDFDLFIHKYYPIITNSDYWHAFVIHNAKNQKRNKILKMILEYVYPEALLPIHFRRRGIGCIFLARNCTGAICKLLRNKLVVPDPNDNSWTYTLEIILRYSLITELTLPTNKHVSGILKLLFDNKSKTLNLEKFADNKKLREYTPLSQPKLLSFVLHLSRELNPACIKLNDNEIRTLYPFEVLTGVNSVRRLDLRNNSIEDMEELRNLKIFDLLELWLDGNPLCSKYNASSYISTIRTFFPKLQKLDGVELPTFGKKCHISKKCRQINKQKVMAEEAMSRITGINKIWAKRLLQDAHYDIIDFLTSFVALLKKNKIPEEAFSEVNKKSLMEWLLPKMVEFGIEKFESSLQKKALKFVRNHPSFVANIDLPPITECERVLPKFVDSEMEKFEYSIQKKASKFRWNHPSSDANINLSPKCEKFKRESRCRNVKRIYRETNRYSSVNKKQSVNQMEHCWRCGFPRPRKRGKHGKTHYPCKKVENESQTCICPIKSSLKRSLAGNEPTDTVHVENTELPELYASDKIVISEEEPGTAEDAYSPADDPFSPVDFSYSSEKDPYSPPEDLHSSSPEVLCRKKKRRNLPDLVSDAHASLLSSPVSESLVLTCASPLSISSEMSDSVSSIFPQSPVLSLSAETIKTLSIPSVHSPPKSISSPDTCSIPTTPISLASPNI